MATISPAAGAAPAAKPSLDAGASTAPPAPPRRALRVLLAVLAVVLAVAAAGAAAFFLLRDRAAHAAAPAQPPKPVFVTLEPLTVNLLSEGKPKFLHLGVSLKVKDDDARARLLEVLPELRSRLMLLLSNRDPATLATPKDKADLAGQIGNELNRPLASGAPALGITGVAFDAFVVQ